MSERIELSLTVDGKKVSGRRENGSTVNGEVDRDKLRKDTIETMIELVRQRKIRKTEHLGILGRHLFATLFKGLEEFFHEAHKEAKGKGLRMCLQLRFEKSEDPMWEWPWEYLQDPSGGSVRFLSTDPILALSRAPISPKTEAIRPKSEEIAAQVEPLRLLMLNTAGAVNGSGAPDSLPVRVQERFTRLEEKYERDLIELKVIDSKKSGRSFEDLLKDYKPRVLHLVSEGRVKDKEVQIPLPKTGGGLNWYNAALFAEIISQAGHVPDLVVLHLHDTPTPTPDSAESFLRFGPDLLENKIKAVVAMQLPADEETAVSFCSAFYENLVAPEGSCVEEAIQTGRSKLVLQQLKFAVPVLFAQRNGNRFAKEAQEEGKPKETVRKVERPQ